MAWSRSSYEAYIYTVRNLSSHIQASNLVFVRRGKFLAEVEGSVIFGKDIILEMRENLSFREDAFIRRYGNLVKKVRTFYTGTTRNPIPTIRIFNPPLLITSTFHGI